MSLAAAARISTIDKRLLTYRSQQKNSLQAQYGNISITEINTLRQIKSYLLDIEKYSIVKKSFNKLVLSNNAFVLNKIKTEKEIVHFYNEIFLDKEKLLEYDGSDEGLTEEANYEKFCNYRKMSKEVFLENIISRNEKAKDIEIIKSSICVNPDVSVVIPAYNDERYVEEAIDSIFSQTLQNWELVIIDDCSTDLTLDIIKNRIKSDDRVTIIKCYKNCGQAHARNIGIRNSKGEYIQFIDSDDQLSSDALHKLLVKAKNDNLDVLLFDGNIFYDDDYDKQAFNWKDDKYHRKNYYVLPITGEKYFERAVSNGDWRESACMALYRHEHISEIKFYEGIIHEDDFFSLQSIISADRVGVIKENFYHRRIRNNSIMTGKNHLKSAEGRLKNIELMTGLYRKYTDKGGNDNIGISVAITRLISREAKNFFKAYDKMTNKEKKQLGAESMDVDVLCTEIKRFATRKEKVAEEKIKNSKTYRAGEMVLRWPKTVSKSIKRSKEKKSNV